MLFRSLGFYMAVLSLGFTFGLAEENNSPNLTEKYREDAGRILGAAMVDTEGWDKLDYLATVIGHRLSGSEGLEEAIAWAAKSMEAEGLKVTLQPVKVPHWVRGEEKARILSPRPRALAVLGLGRSVGTPPEGITAPVVVVRDYEELEALGREGVEGKIVVYAFVWKGYGGAWQYRGHGASRAAELGAVAVLVRSATGHSLATLHTGAMRYDEAQPKIPAAAITVEDAEWFYRMREQGLEVEVSLSMGARTLEDADSFNVILEIEGHEKPEEVVVMGGHYDSWDVGQGVHDDGAACIAAWHSLKILHDLGLKPRRTLRVVLWTNEENGLAGGKAYREWVGDGVDRHVVAIEMDGGNERPVGFGFTVPGQEADSEDPRYRAVRETLNQIADLLEGIDAGTIKDGGGGADIGPLMKDGVIGMHLNTVGEHYFDWHHTEADTLDKVNLQDFRKAMAMLGVMGYALADMPGDFPPPAEVMESSEEEE